MMKNIHVILVSCFMIFLSCVGGGTRTMANATDNAEKRVLLVGASVGDAWNIAHLPERTKLAGYVFESVAEYRFDKTAVMDEVLKSSMNKPDFVILKECAAYFPGDLPRYKQNIQTWVAGLRAQHITPILATVVPVTTPDMLSVSYIKHLVKKVTRSKIPVDERLPYLLQYNDWVRTYAAQEGLAVLDLEVALRTTGQERKLRSDLAGEDGLHLNQEAYGILDRLVVDSAGQLFKERPSGH
jgi:hypothetical protein